MHRWFEMQVAATPDAVAVTGAPAALTYAELNSQANQLAHHLRNLGVGPDTLVGICVEWSQKMIVGILGVLKAGGAYVPLDQDCPKERLAFILNDAAVSVLLSQKKLLARLPRRDTTIVCLDADWEKIAGASRDNPAGGATTANLAHVIYPAGSVGWRGVMVTHNSVVRLFAATDHRYHFGAGDVWPLFHSVAGTLPVWEIWGALLSGGRLVIVPDPGAARAAEAPRTAVEQELVEIWAKVLRVGPVGVNDNFFALGGNSLLATQVLVRIRAAWGVTVSLRRLFDYPTVRALAPQLERLRQGRAARAESAAADLVTGTI